jgi:hypothetical protein
VILVVDGEMWLCECALKHVDVCIHELTLN